MGDVGCLESFELVMFVAAWNGKILWAYGERLEQRRGSVSA